MKLRSITLALFCLLCLFNKSLGQKLFDKLSAQEKRLYNEHILKGQPDEATPVLVRHGYVAHYNTTYRIPDWVAYHVKPEYLKTPPRKGKFSTFRSDPDVKDPVTTADYTGTGYSRGHMAPYFVMGGDRDKNNSFASLERTDAYDETSVYEANYMTNITPQHQLGLNGPGGAWYALETAIRTKLVGTNKMELHLVVGSIILDADNYSTIKTRKKVETNIAIPEEFFQVIIFWKKDTNEFITGAFLFPHVKKKPNKPLIDYIVTVDEVEEKTGLNFLKELTTKEQDKTESQKNEEFWQKKLE